MTDSGDSAFRGGRLLVASPQLGDPNFARAVILLLEHTDEGALGLVLNQPTELASLDVLPEHLSAGLPLDEAVYRGGPVSPDAVIMMGRFSGNDGYASGEEGSASVLDPEFDPEEIGERADSVRVFGGYAGWSAGQLEDELAQDAWIDATPELDDIFTRNPDQLWGAVLERKGGQYALVARMPPDPSVN